MQTGFWGCWNFVIPLTRGCRGWCEVYEELEIFNGDGTDARECTLQAEPVSRAEEEPNPAYTNV